MAITVCGNCIEFGGSYTLCSTDPGFNFDGVIKASDGFCDTTGSPVQEASLFGYHMGKGFQVPSRATIDKFDYSNSNPSAFVGCLTQPAAENLGQGGAASTTDGYTIDGPSVNDIIACFPFASDANATDAGELNNCINGHGMWSSITDGYVVGGYSPSFSPSTTDQVLKFPFAAASPSSDVGELTTAQRFTGVNPNVTHGYSQNGAKVDKYAFASDTATAINQPGALGPPRERQGSSTSSIAGYNHGGTSPPSAGDQIEKFPFSNEASTTDVGELADSQPQNQGTSDNGNSRGYSVGESPSTTSQITFFPFASDTPGTVSRGVGPSHPSNGVDGIETTQV